jgi:PAT family beta-lactamase induction signal transducer AmpG
MLAVVLAKEPQVSKRAERVREKSIWRYALVEPFSAFMKKPYWVVALAVVFCYRLSDAYFAPMAYPFYTELGFSKTEIAYISKLYGMGATIIGGLLGGVALNRLGMIKGLLVFSVVQGLTTALYIPLCYVGHNVWFLMFTIALENLSSGMATTAIIAFMSILCDKGYTATQYALLSSLPGLARDVFAATSGEVLEMTSWPIFFLISALLTLPAVGLCLFLYQKRKLYVEEA